MLHDSAARTEGSVARSFRITGKHTEVRDSDSSTTHISDCEEEIAQLFSTFLKEAMVSANIVRLANCLPSIQARGFSRAIAKKVDLLQTVKEASNHDEFPGTVLGPCRSLLESWEDG
jgi:hypothetical protein